MAGSLNKVELLGHLGADPEVRNLPSGGKVVNMRIATSDSWRDKNSGDRREKTEWHSVVIFNEPLAKVAEQYLRKGSKVFVEGALQTRKWQDQSGNDRYSTEIVLQAFNSRLIMLDGKRDGEDGGGSDRGGGDRGGGNSGGGGAPSERPGANRTGQRSAAPAFDGGADDDIPF